VGGDFSLVGVGEVGGLGHGTVAGVWGLVEASGKVAAGAGGQTSA